MRLVASVMDLTRIQLAVFEKKLLAHTDRSGGPDACWPWLMSTISGFGVTPEQQRGYGQFGGSGKKTGRWNVLAHRASFMVFIGAHIGADVCVLHRCDNPICTNPKHLFLGDRNDNCQDKMQKGRHNYRTHHGTDHGNAKMTDDIVREMRELYATKRASQNQLSVRFGLSQASVWAILHRKTWKHVV